MAEITRSADVIWFGDSRSGNGTINTASGALKETKYTWKARFENEAGTNPEELIAAAEAGCFSMQLASKLAARGNKPESIRTKATVVMTSKEGGGWRISGIRLETTGRVPGVDAETFKQVAMEAKLTCPISVLLTPGLDMIDLTANLE